MSEIKEYYEDRLRHLETPEFVTWFEKWCCKESDYTDERLRDIYLQERNFALAGWLAAKSNAENMTQLEFVATVLPMRK